jgi:hypothetical protein
MDDIIQKAYSLMTWGNTTQTPEDWERILSSGNELERLQLLNHIFREDPTGEFLDALLSHDDKVLLAQSLTRPMWREDIEKRRLLYRSVYLHEQHAIKDYEWNFDAEPA